MESTHGDPHGGIVQYKLVGNPHPIQARKAWEDNETWIAGTLVDYEDRIATVAFGIEERPADRSGFGRGGPVWVTEQWNVLAFADDDGNAISIQALEEMSDSIFTRVGHERLRFVNARLVEEIQEDTKRSGDRSSGGGR